MRRIEFLNLHLRGERLHAPVRQFMMLVLYMGSVDLEDVGKAYNLYKEMLHYGFILHAAIVIASIHKHII